MPENYIPVLVAVIVAIGGSIVGVAALLRVTSDNAKVITDSAVNVVELMQARINENSARLDSLEDYAIRFDEWGDRLITVLDRAVSAVPHPAQETFQGEVVSIKTTRPRKNSTTRPLSVLE